MSARGIVLTLFIFVGAIVTTFLSIWLITIDSQWHLGQSLQQAATISSALISLSTPIPINLSYALLVGVMSNFIEVQHAFVGLSPVTIIGYFLGFFFLFMIVGGVTGLIFSKIDLDSPKFFMLAGLVVGAAVFTTYVAVFLITIDAQWQLNSRGILGILAYTTSPDAFYSLVCLIALGNWDFFEHAQGQSASSYIDWFIIFIVVYIVVIAILLWINKGRIIRAK